jgi:hypothetical protein
MAPWSGAWQRETVSALRAIRFPFATRRAVVHGKARVGFNSRRPRARAGARGVWLTECPWRGLIGMGDASAHRFARALRVFTDCGITHARSKPNTAPVGRSSATPGKEAAQFKPSLQCDRPEARQSSVEPRRTFSRIRSAAGGGGKNAWREALMRLSLRQDPLHEVLKEVRWGSGPGSLASRPR